jgi:DNA-directed RNA polymerase specialized sigma24 family protein
LPDYDPARGAYPSFVKRLVDNQGENLVRDRTASKRYGGPLDSLDLIDLGDPESVTSAARISNEQQGVVGRRSRGEAEQSELTIDVKEVMATLNEDDRDLAYRLTRETLTEIAEATGIPRSTLQSRVSRMRRVFEDAGLAEYLQNRPSTRS